jgi:hypothetical protein
MKIITSAGIRGEFFLTVEDRRRPWLDKLCSRFTSDSASEHYGWLGSVPGLTEVKGEKHTEEVPEYELTIRNKTFDGGLEIKREDVERDKTGLITALLIAATGHTLGYAYDGKNFFAANHTSNKSGTQKNLLTYSDVPSLDVVVRETPTSTEAVKAILSVIAWMLAIKNDQGKAMNATAREFLVMTSPALWQYLVPAIANATINSGDTNTIASLRSQGFNIEIVANPGLTYTYEFDVFRTDAPLKPFAIQEEIPLELETFGPETEFYKLNNKILAKAYTRKNVGYARWEYAAHATLKT